MRGPGERERNEKEKEVKKKLLSKHFTNLIMGRTSVLDD
jgi:hypothetical protein